MTLSQILSVAVASFALLAVLGAGGIAIVAIVSGGREDEDERGGRRARRRGKGKGVRMSITPPLSPKDWTGTPMSMFRMLGASNHCTTHERETHDFYATDPQAVEQLCDRVCFAHDIWEPACGMGHISSTLAKRGYEVRSTDLIDRNYGTGGVDFLLQTTPWHGDIVTNPPYRYATEFVQKALELVDEGAKVAMLLKLTFLEGQKRQRLFRVYPPEWVYVAAGRVRCALNGDFSAVDRGSAMCFAWFVWRKGYAGDPSVRWFN